MGVPTLRLTAAAAIGCGAALVLALGVAGGAGGATKAAIHSHVKIKSINPQAVSGVVTSPEQACEKGRKVKLYYTAPGARGQETLLGTGKTNKKGKWGFTGSFFIGHYHAVVPKKKLSGKSEKGKLEEAMLEAEEDDEDDAAKGNGGACSSTSYSTDE